MTSHYFSENQSSVIRQKEVRYNALKFTTCSGVFSTDKIDTGSNLLIETAIDFKKRNILDLGCGWGAVGLVFKSVNKLANVTLSDVNERAVASAKMNAKQNNLEVKVIKSDGFEKISDFFDLILLNPPQSAGLDVCKRLIQESKAHLNEHGSLLVVARHNKGGSRLADFMESVFGNVEHRAKQSGYRVYCSFQISRI